ncbi:MAG: ATP-dependent metallopeptidase FtsH/Yme1/Tma family protein, partial [Tahibacter sp.]
MAKNLLLWLIIAVVLLTVFQSFNPRGSGPTEVAYSEFMDKVHAKSV